MHIKSAELLQIEIHVARIKKTEARAQVHSTNQRQVSAGGAQWAHWHKTQFSDARLGIIMSTYSKLNKSTGRLLQIAL